MKGSGRFKNVEPLPPNHSNCLKDNYSINSIAYTVDEKELVDEILFTYHAEALAGMLCRNGFVHHSDCIICITDGAFPSGIQHKLFAAQPVLPSARAVRLEIASWG